MDNRYSHSLTSENEHNPLSQLTKIYYLRLETNSSKPFHWPSC